MKRLVLRIESEERALYDALHRAEEAEPHDRCAYRALVLALFDHVDDLFALLLELDALLEQERARHIESLISILLNRGTDGR